MRTYILPLGLFTLSCASVAQGGLLEPISIDRHVRALRGSEILQYGTGVDPFSATVTSPDGLCTASQNSTITVDTISITGSASGYGTASLGSLAGSYLQEKFILMSRIPYRFSLEWSMNNDESSMVSVHLTGPSGDIFREFRDYGNGTWTSRGYLDPGQYDYYVNGGTSAYPDYGWTWPSMSFSAEFSLTPEPATLALAALGALALMRRPRVHKETR